MNPYKVLHAPSSVGNNPLVLSKALKLLGVDSKSLVISQNYLGYKADVVIHYPEQSLLFREIKRVLVILFCMPKYDIIHYNSGTTISSPYDFDLNGNHSFANIIRYLYTRYLQFLQIVELWIIKVLKKVVFVTYQGDDARQGDFCLLNYETSIASQVPNGYYDIVSDNYKRRSILKLSALSSKVYALNPDLLNLLPTGSSFVAYTNIFLEDYVPKFPSLASRPLKFIHAPTNRDVKGTDFIVKAFDKLNREGYVFEFTLVENIPHEQAVKIYETADILIDQLFAGWYGGLAVEMMALGKPVMVYIREDDLRFIPNDMREDLPFIATTHQTIAEDIKAVLNMNREDIFNLGKKSRLFVERWHNPLTIAAGIKNDYEHALFKKKAN